MIAIKPPSATTSAAAEVGVVAASSAAGAQAASDTARIDAPAIASIFFNISYLSLIDLFQTGDC
jgi:hypothetical protein